MATTEKKRKLVALPTPKANEPPAVTYAVAMAIRGLRAGTATEDQQKLALEWIVGDAAAKRHFPYHQTDRDTAFALGRVFVAEQIVGLFHIDLSTLRREE